MRHWILTLLPVSSVLGCETRTEFTGGTRLVFGFDPAESPMMSPEALRTALVDMTEKRLDFAGLRQFRVQAQKDRISVDVPSTEPGLDQIKRIVARGGRLEFRLVVEDEVSDAELDRCENEERAYRQALREWRERSATDEEDPAATERRPPEPVSPERVVRRDSAGERMLLENTLTGHISGAAIESAYVIRDENGRPAVGLELTSDAGARFGELTEKAVNRKLAIVLDGTVLSTPMIQSRIDRRAQITGAFSEQEGQGVVTVLRSGSLPVSLEFIAEEPIETAEGE